jgi:nicotinate-nucleotide pyrophosphorylase (carboxylating)
LAIVIAPHSILREFVERALAEDIGRGDATTQALFSEAVAAEGRITPKTPTVMAGGPVASLVFQTLDPTAWATLDAAEGEPVEVGSTLLTVRGDGRAILTGERVALNILQRLCGIAALTRQFVDAVRGFPCRITDTRKTPAGWRLLDKYAVRCGGGSNHRFGLDDGILIKDTHLALSGAIGDSVRRAKTRAGHLVKVEVEVSTVAGAREAVDAGADVVLLDNMPLDDIRSSLAAIKGRAIVEASGGITLTTVRDVAALGVDCISVGVLTHSSPAADLHLELWPV